MIAISDDGDSKKDSVTHEDFDEILRLKKQINEKIEFFNENASQESIDKIQEYKNKLENRSASKDKNLFEMDKKEHEKKVSELDFYSRSLDVLNGFAAAFQTNVDIDPGRVMGLSDGIFSIVMTLLIFGMTLPDMELLTQMDYWAFILSMLPKIGVTLVSFILLGSFWIYHHQFIKLKTLNMPFLWLNIIFLACISFIPFTTSMIGEYTKFYLDNILFGFNILLSLFLFVMMYTYVDKRNFLEGDITDAEKRYTYHTFYLILAVSIFIIILDFSVSQDFFYLFLIIPVVSVIRDTIFQYKHRES